MAAVLDRYGTGPGSFGAAFWISDVKTEKTAKKRGKKSPKWARYSHLKRVRVADLFVMDRYFCVCTALIEKVKKGSATACGGTLAAAIAEGQQLESELRERCSKVHANREEVRVLTEIVDDFRRFVDEIWRF